MFRNMAGDFMRPVVDIVDKLLMGGVNVTVYNGQLDLIVDTMGNPPLLYLRNQREFPGGTLCLKPVSPLQVRSSG